MNIKFIDVFLDNKLNRIIIFILLSILIFFVSYNNGMFWDNVLFTSKMGNHLINNNIFNFILPDEIDPGHPPTLAFLLTILWKGLGHKLWVSHLLMIPFTIGLFYQIFELCKFYIKSNIASIFALILIFSDPTLSTQLVIVNPEVIQLFLFFLAINSILQNNYKLKTLALFFLSIISLRGMMLCVGVFLFEFINNLIIEKKQFKSIFSKKFILSYLIGSILGLTFVIAHYSLKGWIISHPNSPWEDDHHFVSIGGFGRNILVLAHRYLDFGRVFILLFILFSFLKAKNKMLNKNIKQLLLLSIFSVIIIIIASLLKTNAFGHRYFIASYIGFTLLSFVILQNYLKNHKIIYILLVLGLISGNFWVYPRKIAQGWDASLAHLPYYNLRLDAIKYLDENKIEIKNVASFFPNYTTIDNVDFSGDTREFTTFNGENDYIFYSNVYNLTDEEYKKIDNEYILIKQFEKLNILINIYKHKNNDNS